MRLISGVKMQRSVKKTTHSKLFASEYEQLILRFGFKSAQAHPLTANYSEEKSDATDLPETIVLFASDRGLCGNYNSQLLKHAFTYIDKNKKYRLIAVGNHATKIARNENVTLVQAYPSDMGTQDFDEIASLANELVKSFLGKETNKVTLIYTSFINSYQSEVNIRQLLPIVLETKTVEYEDVLVEPSYSEILDYGLHKSIQVSIYNALLNAQTSEHSNRMIAMQNATDAATEISDKLTLEYNKLRQGSITQEVAEILNGTLNS